MDEQGMAALLTDIARIVRNPQLSDAEIVELLRRLMAEVNGEAA